jgi:hypothetical protein
MPSPPSTAWPQHLWWLFVALALPLAPVRADWSRQTVRTIQQTTGNSSESLTLQRSSLNAVAASGIRAGAPLIEQGQWNDAVPYRPASEGGAFSLTLTSEPAGTTQRSLSIAPNQLEGSLQPDGRLRAGPGTTASEVQLSILQTYSVF